MLVRAERPEDAAAIHAITAAAFGRPEEAVLVDELRVSPHFIPELSLVAVEDEVVVGHCMFSYAELVGDRTWNVLSLAPVSVRPDRQRDRIGSAVIERGLEIAEDKGEPLAVVLGHPAYYPRFGFEVARPLGILPVSDDIPDEAFMVRRLSSYDPRLRGRIVYPAAFDAT